MRMNPRQKERARALRRVSTPAEQILWRDLRNRRFAGFKFRRQHPVSPFIPDFYCAAIALIIELDGESHLGKEQPDKDRQDWFEAHGFKVLRFWNNEIYDDHEAVQEAIWQECQTRQPQMHPSPPAPLP
jgi:very-short-patch-repair endonuclease